MFTAHPALFSREPRVFILRSYKANVVSNVSLALEHLRELIFQSFRMNFVCELVC